MILQSNYFYGSEEGFSFQVVFRKHSGPTQRGNSRLNESVVQYKGPKSWGLPGPPWWCWDLPIAHLVGLWGFQNCTGDAQGSIWNRELNSDTTKLSLDVTTFIC